MTEENEKPPVDPFIAEITKHFPKQDVDMMQMLQAIQAMCISVQTAGRALDRATWGILILAAVCVAQLLALAMR
jgi:hypothetical protein